MVASFITAGFAAGSVIMLFSFVGIYGSLIGVGGDPPAVAHSLGSYVFGVIALLMMTSSVSKALEIYLDMWIAINAITLLTYIYIDIRSGFYLFFNCSLSGIA